MSSFVLTICIMALLAVYVFGRAAKDSSEKEGGTFEVLGLLEKVLFFPLDTDTVPICKETPCYNIIAEKEVSTEDGCNHRSLADINLIELGIYYLEELRTACIGLLQYSANLTPYVGLFLVTAGVVFLVGISFKIHDFFKEEKTRETVERPKKNKPKSKSVGLQMGDNRGVKRERESPLWTPQKKTRSDLCTPTNPSPCHTLFKLANTSTWQKASPNTEKNIREGQKANLDALLSVRPQKEYLTDHSRDASGLDTSKGSGDSSFLANVENRIKDPSHALESSFEFNQEQSLDFDSSFDNWDPFANSSFVEVDESCEDCQRKLDYFLGPSNPCIYHAKRLSRQRFHNSTSGTIDETDMSVLTSTDEDQSTSQSSWQFSNGMSSTKEKFWNTLGYLQSIVQTPFRYLSRPWDYNGIMGALSFRSVDRNSNSSTLDRSRNASKLLRNSISDLSSSLSDVLDTLE
ncbi:hypothetical protein ACJMK2_029980 [Sinanodonta woodiana]|uniref:Uncharacterized protein n=1 Tax=Sinanodonta woodiana TaxID=1069815 RepID=A0ABD3XBU5_SINWO